MTIRASQVLALVPFAGSSVLVTDVDILVPFDANSTITLTAYAPVCQVTHQAVPAAAANLTITTSIPNVRNGGLIIIPYPPTVAQQFNINIPAQAVLTITGYAVTYEICVVWKDCDDDVSGSWTKC